MDTVFVVLFAGTILPPYCRNVVTTVAGVTESVVDFELIMTQNLPTVTL